MDLAVDMSNRFSFFFFFPAVWSHDGLHHGQNRSKTNNMVCVPSYKQQRTMVSSDMHVCAQNWISTSNHDMQLSYTYIYTSKYMFTVHVHGQCNPFRAWYFYLFFLRKNIIKVICIRSTTFQEHHVGAQCQYHASLSLFFLRHDIIYSYHIIWWFDCRFSPVGHRTEEPERISVVIVGNDLKTIFLLVGCITRCNGFTLTKQLRHPHPFCLLVVRS